MISTEFSSHPFLCEQLQSSSSRKPKQWLTRRSPAFSLWGEVGLSSPSRQFNSESYAMTERPHQRQGNQDGAGRVLFCLCLAWPLQTYWNTVSQGILKPRALRQEYSSIRKAGNFCLCVFSIRTIIGRDSGHSRSLGRLNTWMLELVDAHGHRQERYTIITKRKQLTNLQPSLYLRVCARLLLP